VTATEETNAHPIERWIERVLPGYRFGFVLVLLIITFVFMASGVSGAWVRVVTVMLQGLTLLAALRASQVSRGRFRLAALVVLIAFISSVASLFATSSTTTTGAFFALNVLIVAAAPVVIARALLQRSVVDLHTALGALCIYVLLGMLFAFTYAAIGDLGNEQFFVQTKDATIAEYLYFSFITLTTVGYGDFSAAHGLGRSLAAVEALTGQIYLVTVVAAIVSSMASARRVRAGEAVAESDKASAPTSP
jgi:hypothetical protein